MKKSDREKVFNKYGGKCAYCGCELQKGWHVDHAEPIHRRFKHIGGNPVTIGTGLPPTENDIIHGNYKFLPKKTVSDGCFYPEHDHIENMMPSCASCNINKGGASIETYRGYIERRISFLNKNNPGYRIAKRYGLIQETGIEVKFYFETN